MSDGTHIQWTDSSWSPITGCTRVSEGCNNCYSARLTYRLEKMGQAKYTGLTVLNKAGDRHFNGVVKCHDDELDKPLRWRKPRRIFVNSMSDTFHKEVPFEFIDEIFALAALCPRHTFQILTKRPERAVQYYARDFGDFISNARSAFLHGMKTPMAKLGERFSWNDRASDSPDKGWQLHELPDSMSFKNVWLGCSVENQEQADKRIPQLLRCPAAVHFLSVEPLLGPIDLADAVVKRRIGDPQPSWVIVGGESGPGARPCDAAWIRSIVSQCKAASVPCFVKQIGAKPFIHCGQCGKDIGRGIMGGFVSACGPTHAALIAEMIRVNDSKGGDETEWPEDLRVREFPKVAWKL